MLALMLALTPRPAGAGLFDPATFTLANGLEVVVITDHRAPVVNQTIWYKVGSADEPPGQSGVAHLLEHLMFKATATRPSGEFSRIVSGFGGRENAFTSHDVTAYFQVVARQHLPVMMRLEADRMRNLRFTAQEAQAELQVVLEERLSRIANNPAAEFDEQMDAVQFLGHPYGRPIIGWESELQTLNKRHVEEFYRRYYAPNNAILVIIGDVTAKEVRPLAEKYYGPIKSSAEAVRPRRVIPPQTSARRLEHLSERAPQPIFRRTYLAPSRTAGEARHAVPLMALSQILGGGPTSRLHRELVKEQLIAAEAVAWYDSISVDPSVFGVQAVPKAGGDLQQIETAVDQIVADLLQGGVTQAELDRVRTGMLAQAIYARDGVLSAARYVGQARAAGVSLAEIESWPDQVRALNVEMVNAAARHVLSAERSVTGRLIPKSTVAP